MSEPAPALVDVLTPAGQLRVGDFLLDEDGHTETVQEVFLDVAPDYVYVFTPEQRPFPRDSLVRVLRPPLPRPPVPAVDPVEYAAVRDLALALGDLAQQATPEVVDRTARAAKRVRARQEETRTDGRDTPTDAPVLGDTPAPAGDPRPEPGAVQPPAGDGAPADGGTPPPADAGGTRPDRRGGRAG